MKIFRILLGAVIVLALAGAGFLGYQKYFAAAAQSTPTATVPPVSAEGARTVSATGNVTPETNVKLAALQGGRIAQILVKAGDPVKSGSPLVVLETDTLQSQVAQAQAALDAAQANLSAAQAKASQVHNGAIAADAANRTKTWNNKLPSEITQPNWYFSKAEQIAAAQKDLQDAKNAVDTEQSNLDAVLKKASSSDVVQAETRLANAQAAFLAASDVLDRAKSSGAKDLQDQAQKSYDDAKSELDAAQNNYSQILTTKNASDVTEARARLAVALERYHTAQDRLNNLQTGEDSPDVKAADQAAQQAQAAVNQAKSALDAANLALKQATIVAPFDGTVADKNVEVGQVVTPGSTLVVLANFSKWTVETTDLAESDVASIQPGMNATITLDAFPNRTFKGTVRQVALVSEDNRGSVAYKVTLDFNPQGANVRWGMTANVDIAVP